jgi:hypothetical protein
MREKPKNRLDRLQRTILKFLIAGLIGILLTLAVGQIEQVGWLGGLGVSPGIAQSLRPEDISVIVYERLSYLPKENQYISVETGEVNEQNTLLSRFIRYHQNIKKRPTRFRLDWKLTFADYLGVNEPIREDSYPGSQSLQTNPMENDLKIINSLNRRQREELIDLLISLYHPKQGNGSETDPTKKPTAQPSPSPGKPTLSKPGDAQLLMP